MKSTAKQWIYAVLITGLMLLTPVIGIWGPFNNGDFGGQPSYELFLPAGYAFFIWAVINIGLFSLGIWQGLPSQRHNKRAQAAAPWLVATVLGNGVWIVLAGSIETIIWTVPTIIFMEVTGWFAYLRLGIGRVQEAEGERWLHFPLQVYVGWLSVATIANTAAALNKLGWNGWGIDPVIWTLVMIVAAVIVAWGVGWLMGHDNVYRGVFVWAFVGIFVAQLETPVVAWAALAAAVVIVGMIVWTSSPRATGKRLETVS